MSTAVWGLTALLALPAAVAVHDLQHRLERWAYDRHLED